MLIEGSELVVAASTTEGTEGPVILKRPASPPPSTTLSSKLLHFLLTTLALNIGSALFVWLTITQLHILGPNHRSAMAGRNVVAWSRSEEKNLPIWLKKHQGLSWKERSKEYFRQYQIHRTDESLRGKLNELRRRRSSTGNLSGVSIERARVMARRGPIARRRTICSGSPSPLPTIVLRVPDLKVKRALERVRRRRSSSFHFPQQSCKPGPIILRSEDKLADV